MRRNRFAFLAALIGCGALSVVFTPSSALAADADRSGQTLKPVVGVKFGMESALASLIGGTVTGEVTQVMVNREEPTRVVVTVSYTGFEGGKLWGEVTTSDRKTQKLIRFAAPRALEGTPGEMELTFELDPNAPDNTLIKTSYVKICVAKAEKTAASYVKGFELPKTWQNGMRPENVLVTVTPKPIGTTATLGPTPGAPLPPRVIHPSVLRVSPAMVPARTLTIQPRAATMAQPPAASPAPPPAASQPAPAGTAVRSMNIATTRTILSATPSARMMTPNTAVAAKTDSATRLLPKTAVIASVSRFKFGLPQQDPASTDAVMGPAETPVEPLAELRSEDIELDPSHVLGVFPAFYPDQNPKSGVFYFLPYSYSLRWSEDAGYDLRMIYSATGPDGAGEVAMAARLDAGLGSASGRSRRN